MAVLVLSFASCSKETTNLAPNPDETGKTFTFVMPSQGSAVTYAGEVPASATEKFLSLANTRIYMFRDSDGTLEAIIPSSAITRGTNSTGQETATIGIDDAWVGDKTFFVVGNIHRYATTPMGTVTLGMAQGDFMNLVTSPQTATLSAAHSQPDSQGLLMTGSVQVANIESTPASNITLYRSVARFDVLNNVTTSGVIVKTIDVTNANKNGYVVAYGRGIKPTGLVKSTDADVFFRYTVPTTTVAGDTNGIGGSASDRYQKRDASFYLYPTQLKVDGTATIITLIGEVSGADKVFTLNKEESNLPVNNEIKANTRYIISAIDIKSHTFTITVAEWDEGDVLVGHTGLTPLHALTVVGTPTITNGTFNAMVNSINVTNPASAFNALFKVKASSKGGVSAQIVSTTGLGLTAVGSDIITATATYDNQPIGYAIPYYGYNVNVSFAASKINAAASFTTIIRLTDSASGESRDYVVYKEGTTSVVDGKTLYPTGAGFLPAVKVGGIDWAPVNVGAMQLTDGGKLYQWGRNTPFLAGAVGAERLVGPVSVADGISATNLPKFIEVIAGSPSWWTADVDGNSSLWNTNTQGPCPTGWRLPTYAELSALRAMATTGKVTVGSDGNHGLVVGDVAGETLRFQGNVERNGNPQGRFTMWVTGQHDSDKPLQRQRYFNFNFDQDPASATGATASSSAGQDLRGVRCVK